MSYEHFNPALFASTSTAASQGATTSEITIPKLIHFIWAGGQARISLKNLCTVIRWGLDNFDWHINIWVDELTDPDVISSNYYQVMVSRLLNDPQFSKIDPRIKETLLDRIHVYDISNNPTGINFRNEYVAYELDKLIPNHGSSSDLLRLAILDRCGGAYFDFDVYPSTTKLSGIYLRGLPKHKLYIDHYSQVANPPQEFLEENQIYGSVGNDTLICTINNPLVKRVLEMAYRNYNKDNPIECAYSGMNFINTTMNRTGPSVIYQLLLESIEDDEGFYRLLDDVEIHRTRDGRYRSLSQPAEKNNAGWVRMFAKNTTHDLAVIAIKKTITFELKYFGIIRIDDHINDLIISCNSSYQDSILLIQQILDFCQPYLNSMPTVQVTGRFPETVDFCQHHKCRTLFNLDADDLKRALDFMLQPWFLKMAPEQFETCVRFLNDRMEIITGIISVSTKFTTVPLDTLSAKLNQILKDYRAIVTDIEENASTNEGVVSLKIKINACLEQPETLTEIHRSTLNRHIPTYGNTEKYIESTPSDQIVDLSNRVFHDSDMKNIAQLLKAKKHTKVIFGQGNISDEGVAYLAQCTDLVLLNIIQNNVGDEGVRILLRLPNLRELHLPTNFISVTGALLIKDRCGTNFRANIHGNREGTEQIAQEIDAKWKEYKPDAPKDSPQPKGPGYSPGHWQTGDSNSASSSSSASSTEEIGPSHSEEVPLTNKTPAGTRK